MIQLRHRPLGIAGFFALSAIIAGCGDNKSGAGSASNSASPKPSHSPAKSAMLSAKTTPAKTEDVAATLPEKGSWEAVKITYAADKDGAPQFKMENLGKKTVIVCFIDFYGYDDKGKQIAHQELSWNGELKGGKTDDTLSTKTADGVKKWEATYHGIKFDGDKDVTMDPKRAPTKRAMGA